MRANRDANGKRVCDLSDDNKTAIIRRGDCETVIRVGKDGTLSIISEKLKQAS